MDIDKQLQLQLKEQIVSCHIKFYAWLKEHDMKFENFIKDKRYARLHDDANFINSLRNIVQHNDFTKLVVIKEEAVDRVESFVMKLTTDINLRMVSFKDINKAVMGDKVLPKLKEMSIKNYSYLPIVDYQHTFVEVFSAYILQSYLCSGKEINDKTTFADIYNAIDSGDSHIYDNVDFAASNTPLVEVESKFRITDNFHIDVVLVTEDGTSDSKVLGMLTVWDLQ